MRERLNAELHDAGVLHRTADGTFIGARRADGVLTAAPNRHRGRLLGAAAAAIICVSGLGGYLIGYRLGQPEAPALTEPVMPATTPRIETVGIAPPAPTAIIRLEPGVDGQERSGGD